jgi:RpiB/LacA/LacB family sugar-phosphate isomerase
LYEYPGPEREAAMRIAVGSDHAGYQLKEHIARLLRAAGHDIVDVGTHSEEPVDYPDFAAAVGRMVLDGTAERGIVVCGSGAGASIAANKLRGIRAGLAHDTYTAHQCVEHDDVNVLAIGSRVVGTALADEIITAFVNATFSGAQRHVRRVNKVKELENEF